MVAAVLALAMLVALSMLIALAIHAVQVVVALVLAECHANLQAPPPEGHPTWLRLVAGFIRFDSAVPFFAVTAVPVAVPVAHCIS